MEQEDVFEIPDPNREVVGWTSFATSSDGDTFIREGKWAPMYADEFKEKQK